VKVFYCDQFVYALPPGHRFPAQKYALLRAQVAESLTPPVMLRVPDAASDEQLLRAHDAEYLAQVAGGALSEREVRRIGLPWSPELVERSRRSIGGTIEACRAALADGIGSACQAARITPSPIMAGAFASSMTALSPCGPCKRRSASGES
jgi:acetoin utilization deacetylase AcuC-like enzyme